MSVLVIAFDGLDHDLVQQYALDAVMQTEYGRIDNHTGVSSIKTSELFASLITGTTYEKHGVRGLSLVDHPVLDRVERVAQHIPGLQWSTALRTAAYRSLFGARKRRYNRSDLAVPAIFDQIPGSRAVFVPAYNPSPVWEHRRLLDYPLPALRNELEKEFHWRRQHILNAVQQDYPLLMAHIHYPDFMQHFYWELDAMEELETVYERINTFAEAIIADAHPAYDTVIFLSDHGLPTATAHNENAFYSCNRDLGLETPHITDFHDLLIDLTGQTIDI